MKKSTNHDKLDELEAKVGLLEKTIGELKGVLAESIKTNSAKDGGKLVDKCDTLSEVERKKIDYILRHFEFGKVYRVMEALDWRWATVKKGMEVPSIEDMKAEAKRLLVDACFEKTTIATGGFKATYEATPGDPDGDEFIQLEFIVADEEGFDDDDDEELDD